MPNESDSGHDASARTGNARAPHTPADADIFDQAGDKLEQRVAAAVPPQFQRGQGNGGDRGGGGGGDGQVRERRPLRADLGEEPAGDAGAAGPAGAERGRRGAEFRKRRRAFLVVAGDVPKPRDRLPDAAFALAHQIAEKSPIVIRAAKESLNGVLAERGRRRAWVLAGFAALAILVAGTVGVVVVSRSDGSRPAGKIVSDRTTAPTTITTPLPTTIPPVPEASVPAPSVPPAPPQTTARTPTTSPRTVAPRDEGAVEPPPPPPAPPTQPPPPPPATQPPPPTQPPPLRPPLPSLPSAASGERCVELARRFPVRAPSTELPIWSPGSRNISAPTVR